MIVTNQLQVPIPSPETATRQLESLQMGPDATSTDSRYLEHSRNEFLFAGRTLSTNTDQSMPDTTPAQNNTREVSVPAIPARSQQEPDQAGPEPGQATTGSTAIDPYCKESRFGPSVQESGVPEDHCSEVNMDEHEPMIVSSQAQVSIPPSGTATRQPGRPMTDTTLAQGNTTEVSVPSIPALSQQESGQAGPDSISDDNEHSKDSTNKSGEAVGSTDHSLSMVPPHPSNGDISHNVQKQPMDTKPWYPDTPHANVLLGDEIGFSFPARPPSPPDPPSSIWEEDSDQTNRKEPCNQPTQEEYPIMSTASVTPSVVGITCRTLDEVSHNVISSSAPCYDSYGLNYAAAARENTYVFSDSSLLGTQEDSSWGTNDYTAEGDLPNMSQHSHWRRRGPVEDTDESTGSHLGEPSHSGHQVSRSTSGGDIPPDASSISDIQVIGDYASGCVSTTLSVIVDFDDSGITTENRIN